MDSGDVETFFHAGAWINRLEGSGEVFGTAGCDRGTAIWEGRARARRDEVGHTVREVNGTVSQRNDYAPRGGAHRSLTTTHLENR